jgi:hypothetical protein
LSLHLQVLLATVGLLLALAVLDRGVRLRPPPPRRPRRPR